MVDTSSPRPDGMDRPNRVEQLRETLTKLHLIAMARLVDRTIRRCLFGGVKALRSLARSPLIGPVVDPVLARVDKHDRLHFELEELLRVCTALSDENLPYWVAGGWGLDALVGCQTRRHRDLDIVILPFGDNLPKVAAVLTGLGYERQTPLGGTVWFPDAEVYLDDRGHDVQVLNINWDVLTSVAVLLNPVWNAESEMPEETVQVKGLLLEQFTSTGALDGVSIPALSLKAQKLFHLGYPQRPEEPHAEDVIRLISQGEWINPLDRNGARLSGHENRPASTLLLIPIFAFPPDLWRLCRLYHNDLLIPPHVTLAIPFQPLESVSAEVVRRLTRFFEETFEFDFELNAVRWFDNNVVYLEPSNAEAFRSITERLQELFPDFQPYGGMHDSVIPHVTLSEHGTLADRRIVGRLAPKYTPISARASHVWLMSNHRAPNDWAIVKIFHLGATRVGQPNK